MVLPPLDHAQVLHHGLGKGLLAPVAEVDEVQVSWLARQEFPEEVGPVRENPLAGEWMGLAHLLRNVLERAAHTLHGNPGLPEASERHDLHEVDEGERHRLRDSRNHRWLGDDQATARWIFVAPEPVSERTGSHSGKAGGLRDCVKGQVEAWIGRLILLHRP